MQGGLLGLVVALTDFGFVGINPVFKRAARRLEIGLPSFDFALETGDVVCVLMRETFLQGSLNSYIITLWPALTSLNLARKGELSCFITL